MIPETTWVVVAWVERVEIPIPWQHRRADLGEGVKTETALIPKAVTWLIEGTESDVQRARDFAKRHINGTAQVYTFPREERDPLQRAKDQIMGEP